MAAHLPSIVPRNEKNPRPLKDGNYGIPDAMIYGGPTSLRAQGTVSIHPVETGRKLDINRTEMDLAMLKSVQGIHAPMRIRMEREAASKIQRLPFLTSSNLMVDTLEGNDEIIAFKDVLNVPNESEVMINPHLSMERNLGFL